jgi:uncharacterized membrane protein
MLAPCRTLRPLAALRWLDKGWRDVRTAPLQSLTFGALTVILSYLISAASWAWGNLGLYLGLVSGFVFMGPWLAMTLYAISRRIEQAEPVTLPQSMAEAMRSARRAIVFAVIMIVVLLVWARAANMMYIFFPQVSSPGWQDLALFFGVGSAVGALFCMVIFTASAFSLPMLMDRDVDAVTAIITSTNAVLRNKPAMLIWAVLIVAGVVVSALTAWLAFIVVMPVIGHATWHAYRETIDASDWPKALSRGL